MNALIRQLFVAVFLSCQISSAQWNELESDIKTNLLTVNNLTFSSKLTAWIQSNSLIYKTDNGGKNWNLFPLKCSNSKLLANRYISFADNKNGWILRNDTLYHTIDGGNQWYPIKLSTNKFEMIRFQAADKGVAFTNSDPYFTVDSGKTWEKAQIERQIACSDIHFCDALSGWIAGSGPAFDAGSILATKDGGKSWHFILENSYEFESVWGFDSLHIIAGGIGSKGQISVIKTTFDGGKSWISTNTPSCVTDITFIDPYYGVAVSALPDSMFLQSTDGGRKWTPIYEIKASVGYATTSFENTLYILTIGPSIYKYEKPTVSVQLHPIFNRHKNIPGKELSILSRYSCFASHNRVLLNGQKVCSIKSLQTPKISVIIDRK